MLVTMLVTMVMETLVRCQNGNLSRLVTELVHPHREICVQQHEH